MSRYTVSGLPTFSRTLTIFNRFFDGTDTVWYKTTLDGCFLSIQNAEGSSSGNIVPSDAYLARIPLHQNGIGKKEWDALEEKDGYYTFAPGDLCVIGEVEADIEKNTSGTGLLREYGGFVIRSVIRNDAGPLAHWRIGGV
ncbi:MAG TPA: hypothetical protein IAB04_02880 [Candidatus Avimonoglobus intestinipullorum]|uniref:Uncharacterized protein n=1 Tax=Candidatus Avimonoglobus intestinipullorum TaxID=2840699 RepID=A0A9D1LUE4_9FIRM|nr:hypothetical protein [Candidatus Avimonoglobus intestinipullorum]